MLTQNQLQVLFKWANGWRSYAYDHGGTLKEDGLKLAAATRISTPWAIYLCEVDEMPPAPPELQDLADKFLDPKNASGLTLGHIILIKKGCLTEKLLRHELQHVKQVEEAGGMEMFLREYIKQVMEHGYYNAPYEVEARAAENGTKK